MTDPLDELRRLDAERTPGEWRVRGWREDATDDEHSVWGLAAGWRRWHHNKGDFHPDDAMYPEDESHPVEVAFDRDYSTPEGAIAHKPDAEWIAACSRLVPVLLARLDELEAGTAEEPS